jgi:uncharacterized protein DUF4255
VSAALALAATSEVLRFVITQAMTRAAAQLAFPAPAVSTGAPPKPDQAGKEASLVNLFLHMATPNPAWRNMHAPTRDAQGRRLNNAPLVLDAQYLLSAHGPEASREIALATAMHALHQTGVVPRELVRQALRALQADPDPVKKVVASSELADQIESVTISHQTLDIDAVTKIWTALQVPYRPSSGYLVTTVFLEDQRPARVPLPVADSGVNVVTLKELTIALVEGRKGQNRSPVSPSANLYVKGTGFDDSTLTATLGSVALTPDVPNCGPTHLLLKIPAGGIANLAAGPQLLQLSVTVDLDGRPMPLRSAAAAVTLLPDIVLPANPNPVPATPGDATSVTGDLAVDISPPVGRGQAAVLSLTPLGGGTDQGAVWTPPAPVPPVDTFTTLTFKLKKVPKGDYVVRVSVDGTANQPMPDNTGKFAPRITL